MVLSDIEAQRFGFDLVRAGKRVAPLLSRQASKNLHARLVDIRGKDEQLVRQVDNLLVRLSRCSG
jgi:hypothetical protein